MNSISFLKYNINLEEHVHPNALIENWKDHLIMTEKNGVPLDLITFPIFNDKLCQELIEVGNNYGYSNNKNALRYTSQEIQISEFPDLEILIERIIKNYVYRVVEYFWQCSHQAIVYDKHFGFMLKYETNGEMAESAIHLDNSQYTLLVCLNDDYEGGGTFYPRQNVIINPEKGHGLIHPFCNRRHGGRTITYGNRYIYSAFVGAMEL